MHDTYDDACLEENDLSDRPRQDQQARVNERGQGMAMQTIKSKAIQGAENTGYVKGESDMYIN